MSPAERQGVDSELSGLSDLRLPPTMSSAPSLQITPTSSSHSQKQQNLLLYLFHPCAVTNNNWRYSDVASLEACEAGRSDLWEENDGRVWSEPPGEMHSRLTDEHRNECVAPKRPILNV